MEQDITEQITRLVFQLAIILAAAKLAGEVCDRFFKVPPVLGELVAGVVIGPYALGGLHLGPVGPLFQGAREAGANPISVLPTSLYAIAQVGAVVLLFAAGMETDLKQFLRYAGPASVVAAGGVLVPFALGATATVWFGFGHGFTDPVPLFMGAILTATSVGITARVLSDLHRLGTPEGVTVLAAAVVDDVLGILVLTIVVGIAATGHVTLGQVALVGGKAIGFWVALTGLGILASGLISRALGAFRVTGAAVALALALAFLAAGLAQSVGLAMIIGAYSIGLALSGTELARRIEGAMHGVYYALVPVFFVAMGMLVDLSAMRGALVFGGVITALAIVGKVFGCGLPALGLGFNLRGAWRIGLGMLPRGEVALIVAGVGLAQEVIDTEIFGVSIMMTAVTTLVAPILLVPVFRRGGPGTRAAQRQPSHAPSNDPR
ncbi:MAG: cation:proton antiporter [Chloroflexi bacterium]|nr:cation:proton antiporter [Chloroflexota bacterium]